MAAFFFSGAARYGCDLDMSEIEIKLKLVKQLSTFPNFMLKEVKDELKKLGNSDGLINTVDEILKSRGKRHASKR